MAEEIDPFDRLRGIGPDDDPSARLERPRPGHPLTGSAARSRRTVAGVVRRPARRRRRRDDDRRRRRRLVAAAGAGAADGGRAAVRRADQSSPPPTPTSAVAGPVAADDAGRRPSSSTSPAPSSRPACTSCRPAPAPVKPSTPPAGPAPDADVDALNLAAPLRDGERVYVPVVGEAVPPPLAVGAPGSSVPPGPGRPEPGDGGRARRAARHRAGDGAGDRRPTARRTGRSPSVDDLEQVRGIGPAKLATIRPLVTV